MGYWIDLFTGTTWSEFLEAGASVSDFRLSKRIYLTAMTLSSEQSVVGKPAEVERWKPIADVIAEAGSLTAPQVRAVMQEIKETISNHMPTVSRFYIQR